MSTTARLVGFLLALQLGGTAAASTIGSSEFDFSAPLFTEEVVEGLVLSASHGEPITVIATGGLISGPDDNVDDNVDAIRGDWGLGVLNRNVSNDRSGLFQRVHVDGTNSSEFIRLEFSKAVQIEKIFFSYVGPFERFDLAIDGVDVDVVSLLGTDEIYQLAPSGMAPGFVNLPSSLPFGKTWDFYARTTNDEWNIEGLRTAVPEPTALAGLIGLALCGLLGRRARR